MDATIIEAPRGQTREDGVTHTRDPGATFTRKQGRACRGYKAHIATDGNGVITDYRFDTAATHDSKHADELMADELDGGLVFADSAYIVRQRAFCYRFDAGEIDAGWNSSFLGPLFAF